MLNKMTGILLIFFNLLGSPIPAQSSLKQFSLLPSGYTSVNFRNDIIEDEKVNYIKYQYIYHGGGVAIGDINNDGLPDIYFSSTLGYNKLYLNLGNLKFKDITEKAGVGGVKGIMTGVNMIDINNDGFLDILVCKSDPFDLNTGQKILYINNGDGTFTNKAKQYGLDDDSYTIQAYFFDYDGDGDMDVFFVNHPRDLASVSQLNSTMENGRIVRIEDTITEKISNRLFENRNGHFVDVTKRAGLLTHYAFGLSAAIFDFNHDGLSDIYVTNDYNKPDYLYLNNGDGTFHEDFAGYFEHASFFSMGMDINDLNNDGLEDVFNLDMSSEAPVRQKQLYVLNLNYDKFQLMKKLGLYNQYPHNCVNLNNGNGHFSDISWYSGMAQTDWSWSPLIADYNNDGWKDVYITNGYKRDVTDWDYKEFTLDSAIRNAMTSGHVLSMNDRVNLVPQTRVNNYFYHNNGTLKFDDSSKKWIDAPPSFSYGAAYADLDNDGDLDLVVNNVDDEAFILKNNENEIEHPHYLRFRFFKNEEQKQEVYGASVKLDLPGGLQQVQHYDPQRGYMSTMEHALHFGTGNVAIVPKIEIRFMSGKQIILTNVKSDQVLNIYESDALQPMVQHAKPLPVFTETTPQKIFNYTHIENDYIDFKREPLIPYKCSAKGPYYAMADVNSDGLEDIYIGGAAGKDKTLMLQGPVGVFTVKTIPVFDMDKKYEDGGALFFDADGDGDMDMYVVSGGAEFDEGNSNYQDRLYINDGKGNFTRSGNGLPKENHNGSCVVSLDFNNDGQTDLFVGGGVLPGKFPKHDRNMLLQNDHGSFKDVTDSIAPELALSGIVNSATWDDLNGDGVKELVIAGEWMPVMIFSFKNGKFTYTDPQLMITDKNIDRTISMKELTGWWNCIRLEDVDNDGRPDIIVGNRGLNSRIFAGIDEPCTIYANDFDNNGSYDAVLGYYISGQCYPMYHRDQLIDQMPMFRKKYTRYRMYAGQTMDELFSDEQKQGMDTFTTRNFASGIFYNEGNNRFRFRPFPEMAQLSTINDILFSDFDKDGNKDLLVCGNNSDGDVSTGNYDAMAILLMKGDGKGNFTPVSATVTGLNIRGEVRKMVLLKVKNYQSVILLKNSGTAQIITTK